MAGSPTTNIEVDSALLERARRVARERGVAVPQLVREALEHELGPAEGKRKHSGGGVDPWGDLDAWSDAAGEDTMDMLDEEEAEIGFSWEQRSAS